MRKMTYTLLAAAMAAAVLAGCSRNGEAQKATQAETSAAQETVKADGQEKETEAETEAVELATGRHHVKIEVKDYGTISVELYGDEAPISVTNFLKLAGDGFYDGLTFHRIISGFMIQGGDPQGTGMGGSDEMIKGEFSANGVNNPLKHTRGAISMARARSFIVMSISPYLSNWSRNKLVRII